MTQVEPLRWDSDFFGFPIGRVDLDGVDPTDLGAIESEARALGLQCLYASLDPRFAQETVAVQERGYRLVEMALTFTRADVEVAGPPTDCIVR